MGGLVGWLVGWLVSQWINWFLVSLLGGTVGRWVSRMVGGSLVGLLIGHSAMWSGLSICRSVAMAFDGLLGWSHLVGWFVGGLKGRLFGCVV